jgi:hypothetical protein
MSTAPVPIRFPGFGGVFKAPCDLVDAVPFLQTALSAGLKETKTREIEIKFETTPEVARAYFAMKWHLLKKTDANPSLGWSLQTLNDVVALAQFFQDEEVSEVFTLRVENYLDKHFGKKCNCDAAKHDFWDQLTSFITEDSTFAKMIWETVAKDTLLQYIEAPTRRVNTLFKTDFSELPDYIKRCAPKKEIEPEKDLILKELRDELSDLTKRLEQLYTIPPRARMADPILVEEMILLVKKNIQLRVEKLRRKNTQKPSKEENPQKNVAHLAKMAKNGAFS